jgi:hypothetical protein
LPEEVREAQKAAVEKMPQDKDSPPPWCLRLARLRTMIAPSGHRLDLDKSDVTQGVFFRSGNNPEVRASVYGTITPSSLSVLVPATLSGPLNVRVANKINGSVRSFTFMDAITPIT